MKHYKILALCSLAIALTACTFGKDKENESAIQDNPYDDIVVDESLTPEEAQANAEETAKLNRETFNSALTAGDETECKSIASYDLSFSCKQNALIQKAVLAKDKSICAQMDTDKGKKICRSEVEKVSG